MRSIICFCICLFLSGSVFCQLSDLIDKVIFKYQIGGYRWGAPGVFSRHEVLEFKKINEKEKYFLLEKYYRIEKKTLPDSIHTTADTFHISTKNRKVRSDLITKLLYKISTSEDNFTTSFILPNLSRPVRKEIKKVAIKNTYADYLFGEYSTGQERANILRRIKSYHLIDSFILEQKFWTKYSFATTDYYDMYRVELVSSNHDTMVCSSQFSQPLAQPILVHKIIPEKKNREIYNIDVNLVLREILPLNSQLRKKVDLNSLKDQYIVWYLKRLF